MSGRIRALTIQQSPTSRQGMALGKLQILTKHANVFIILVKNNMGQSALRCMKPSVARILLNNVTLLDVIWIRSKL